MSFSHLVNVCFLLYNSSHNTKDRALLESNSSVVLFNVSGRELPAFSACFLTFTMYWLTYVLTLNTYLCPDLSQPMKILLISYSLLHTAEAAAVRLYSYLFLLLINLEVIIIQNSEFRIPHS